MSSKKSVESLSRFTISALRRWGLFSWFAINMVPILRKELKQFGFKTKLQLEPESKGEKLAPGIPAGSENVVHIKCKAGGISVYANSQAEHDMYLEFSSKEAWVISWLESQLKDGGVLYDIGANVGTFSLVAAKLLHGKGKVVAFEPDHALFARFCDNIVLNNCADTIIPVPFLLSAKTSIAMPRPGEHRPPSMVGFCMDDLIEQFNLPMPNHIKINIADGELLVLEGAANILHSPSLKTIMVGVEQVFYEKVTDFLTKNGLKLKDRHAFYYVNGKAYWKGLFITNIR